MATKREAIIEKKKEKIAKLRAELEELKRNRSTIDMVVLSSPEKISTEEVLDKARMFEEHAREEERKEAIRKRLELKSSSLMKKRLMNTFSNFVAEMNIPGKPKYVKRDGFVQVEEEVVETAEVKEEPVTTPTNRKLSHVYFMFKKNRKKKLGL